MNLFNRLPFALFIGALLLSVSTILHADEIQDANKLFKQGKPSQALEIVNKYLADKPKDAQARFLKGLIYTDQDKTNDAIKIFSALTEDYPELPEPYNNLAVLYDSQGQYDKAKIALERAIRTHPSYATAHENLGDIYAKLASQAYDRALQLDRSNISTQTKLAMIQDLIAGEAHAALPAAAPAKPELAKPVVIASKPAVPESAGPALVSDKINLSNTNEVLNTVNAWASAWSARDVNKYLSFYAADFKTPNGETRPDWEQTRRQRISSAKNIQVTISKAAATLNDDNHATVKFHQLYQASNFKAAGNKTLLMVRLGNKWLIQEERN